MLRYALLLIGELVLLLLWVRLIGLWLLAFWFMRRCRSTVPSFGGTARVSVVIPAFEEEALIETTLSSLQQSTSPPWEVIVVDDGSTDRTAVHAARGLTPFTRGVVRRHDQNRGKAAAINSGLAACTCDFVLILDADTRLSPDALSAALAEQARTNADAVAFWIEVEHTHDLLALLQHQEYLAAFNLQRAGLTAMGIMAILPGPATLFRRSVLEANPLLSRTCTEDADLTLTLSRSGYHLTMAASARARTVVPRSWRALIGQRTRWLTGHLQCIRFHLPTIGAGSVRHRLLILPNFLVSTLALSLGLLVILAFVTSARSPLLDLDLPMVMMITSGLLYLQRVSSWLIFGDRKLSIFMVFLEPLVSGLVASITFPLAVKRLALDQRIHPWKGTWAPPR